MAAGKKSLEQKISCKNGCRVRFERSRSRTRERALLAMEQLINSTAAEKPDAFSRSW